MEKFKFLSKDKISQIPKNSGVYAFKKGKEILYIGKAANLRERIKNHFQQPTFRDNFFINQVSKVGFIKTNSEIKALILEAKLIKKYQPKYNVVWRDDKNYFYIGVTKEDFPRIFWTHQPNLKTKKLKNLKTDFVGPFVDGKALKQTLKVLRKVFSYRSCYKIPKRPCLWYHLNRCPGPCLLKFSKTPLLRSSGILEKMERKIKSVSQRNAKNLIKILKAEKNSVLKELKREMKLASKNQDFEEAAKIRDQIEALEKILAHSKIFSEPIVPQTSPWYYREIEKKLRNLLKIKKVSRIEAYDVSNIQGQEATGAMVTFINGQPEKNFYRKFKIKIEGRPNDTAMIKEVLSRRFKHPEWGWPDLILIDGGKPQLSVAVKSKIQNPTTAHFQWAGLPSPVLSKKGGAVAKSKDVKVMAIAKRKNELFIEGEKVPVLLKNLPRDVFNLILQLRDEAHRFALSYHRKLRKVDLLGKF
jgi:excinuclease ABC subunit C